MIDSPSYLNPFRPRASEDQRDAYAFLRNFGVGALDLVPETSWNRPLVIRSAPGGGKTSLMRMFTVESLLLTHRRRDRLAPLAERLTELGALATSGPRVLGLHLGLEAGYRTLLDLDLAPEVSLRLFYRLLDARIVISFVQAALRIADLPFPDGARLLRLEPIPGSDIESAADRLGGLKGSELLEVAVATQREVLSFLDSLLPVEQGLPATGHHELYALRLLSGSRLLVNGDALEAQPLLMFDDGHALGDPQRDGLLSQLVDRRISIGRWYAERYQALSDQEQITGETEARDYELIDIEREGHGARRSRIRFPLFFRDVGDRRAWPTLSRYGERDQAFTDLLGDRSELLVASAEVVEDVRGSALGADPEGRYGEWTTQAETLSGYDAAVKWRELAILIAKDKGRPLELFEMPVSDADAARLTGSAVREAARLFLAKEHGLPYYCGADTVEKLGGRNVEQYLSVSGDLFEVMLAQLVLGRPPGVSAERQHNVIRESSREYWAQIPRRLPHGRDVQRLLSGITRMAQRETYRPRAPYAPGVTGIAISMADRALLVDGDRRGKVPNGDRLLRAIASAIAYGVLEAETDHTSKNQQVMVLYLNRLLCPRVWLPLGRGGFQKCSLVQLSGWLTDQGFDDANSLELGLEIG